MRGSNPIVRAAGAVLTMAAAAAVLATPAHAGLLVTSATDCDVPLISQPFAAFGDTASYKRVQGGDFESGTNGWTLDGGAKIVSGDASTKVGSSADSHSLSLPAGSSATTPPVCVGLDEPTLRFMTRKNSGLLSTLAVTVQVQTSLGIWASLPLGVDLGGAWHPSARMLVLANLLPLLPPDKTAVTFTFTPLLGGAWNVDDVYVDPRVRS
jgi:hypothetical protein